MLFCECAFTKKKINKNQNNKIPDKHNKLLFIQTCMYTTQQRVRRKKNINPTNVHQICTSQNTRYTTSNTKHHRKQRLMILYILLSKKKTTFPIFIFEYIHTRDDCMLCMLCLYVYYGILCVCVIVWCGIKNLNTFSHFLCSFYLCAAT